MIIIKEYVIYEEKILYIYIWILSIVFFRWWEYVGFIFFIMFLVIIEFFKVCMYYLKRKFVIEFREIIFLVLVFISILSFDGKRLSITLYRFLIFFFKKV